MTDTASDQRGWACSCGNACATGDRSDCDPLECTAWDTDPASRAAARLASPGAHITRLIETVDEHSSTLERALWHATVGLRAIAAGESRDVEQAAAIALRRIEQQLEGG